MVLHAGLLTAGPLEGQGEPSHCVNAAPQSSAWLRLRRLPGGYWGPPHGTQSNTRGSQHAAMGRAQRGWRARVGAEDGRTHQVYPLHTLPQGVLIIQVPLWARTAAHTPSGPARARGTQTERPGTHMQRAQQRTHQVARRAHAAHTPSGPAHTYSAHSSAHTKWPGVHTRHTHRVARHTHAARTAAHTPSGPACTRGTHTKWPGTHMQRAQQRTHQVAQRAHAANRAEHLAKHTRQRTYMRSGPAAAVRRLIAR